MDTLMVISIVVVTLVNVLLILTVVKMSQKQSSNPDFSVTDSYQKQIKNYTNIIKLNEKYIRELIKVMKEKEEKLKEESAEIQPDDYTRRY